MGPVSDADGLNDIYGIQRLAYHAMEQDGEVLIRKRIRLSSDGLPVPLQLQVLEADYIDTAKIGLKWPVAVELSAETVRRAWPLHGLLAV